jgi:site-specific recombinase XerD
MRYPPEVLSKREIAALLEACGTETWTDRRNRALIVVMYRAGLRVAEALALRPCDVDTERGAIRVLRGKGGRARTVGIDRWGLEELARWMGEHRAMGWSAGVPLFCTGSGRPVTQAYVRRRLPELARAAGIHKRVHAHGLRHTHAAELRAEGIDLAVIRRQLGHSSLLTTVRYLDHLEPESVIDRLGERTAGTIPVTGCCLKAKPRGQAG